MTDIQMKELCDRVIPIFEKFGVERAYLFGSRARGEETEESDYDFLISRGKIESLLQFCGLIIDLEDALNTHVDVITDTSDNDKIIHIAKSEGILIYGQANS